MQWDIYNVRSKQGAIHCKKIKDMDLLQPQEVLKCFKISMVFFELLQYRQYCVYNAEQWPEFKE